MKDIRLIVKLLGGFVAVTLIVLAVGYFGLTGARSLSQNARQIGENILPAVNSLQIIREAQTAFDSEENGLMGKDTDAASIKDAYSMIDEAKQRQDDALKVYGALPRDKEENDLWEKLGPALDAFWKEHLAFMDLEKQYQEAPSPELSAKMAKQSIEVEDPQREALGEIIDQAITLNNKRAAAAVANAAATSVRVGLISAVGLIAGPGLALFLGIMLALSITRPLAKGVAFARRMAGGDFTQLLDIHQKDEVGAIAEALNTMAVNLRGIVATVQSSAQQVASSSEEITASAQKLSEGAQTQASTLEETSASIEELSASIDQVTQQAQSQSATVEQGTVSMKQVQKSIEEVSGNLTRISELAHNSVDNAIEGARAIQQVVEGINLIAQSSEKIGGIVDVISDIADQTNLLALNASIEAARAGEHGRGFAVVADEVSKLADRSASSTKEIVGLIKESAKNVTAGVDTAIGSQKAMEKIREASQSVKETITVLGDSVLQQVSATRQLASALANVSEMSATISAATEEQTTNARQVSKAVENVNELTQGAAAAAEQMSSATEELAGMASELQKVMAQFKIGGGVKTAAVVPVRR